MKIFKQIDLCFIFQPQEPKVQSCVMNQQKLKTMKFQHPIKHFIRTLIRAFRSTRSILVYRVEKSKDCNRSGEALSLSDLERLRLFITSTTPVESLRIQLLSQGTSAFLSLDTQMSLTVGNIALKKEHIHLEKSVRELELAAQINLGLIGFL
jgi:hypothetical protein